MAIQSRHFTQIFPKVVKNPKGLLRNENLLANAVPIAAFLTPMGGLLFSPILIDTENRKKKMEKPERKKAVTHEVISQLINAIAHMAGFVLGGKVAKRYLPKINPQLFKKGSSALENGETAACIVGSFIGMTFVRPVLAAKLMKDKDNHDKGKPDDSSPGMKEVGDPARQQQQTSLYQYYYA